jgi:hypothetical protein
MADPSRYPDSREDSGVPRWVKVIGILVIVVVLLVVVILLVGGGGEHGPGRHTSLGGDGGNTPAVSVSASGGHTACLW